jgi:hypothetical protein
MRGIEEVGMRTWSVRAMFCAGLCAVACASVFPLFSPGVIQASGQPPPGPYGGCPAPTNPGFNFCNPGEPNPFAWEIPGVTQLIVAATSGSGQVSLMEAWADGKKIGQAAGSPFDEPVTLGCGTHTLTVIEQDATGTEMKSAPFQLSVQCDGSDSERGIANDSNNCPPPSAPGVNVCNPYPDGCNTGPWVYFSATGKGASGSVNRMELWIEGTKIANFPGNQISTSLIMVWGEVGIVEVDSKGHSISSSFFFNGPC